MADTSNGQASGNGSLKAGKALNGVNSHSNGNVVQRRRTPPVKPRPGFLARIFSIAARLLTWYSIFTLLLRCPSTLDACDETSPKICKPYFQFKQAVTPHLTPYFDAYAAPYVDFAKPYYETVDRTVITPARTYAVKYGGPQLTKAQSLGLAQWKKNVQPQFTKYQAMARAQYDQSIAPHVGQASAAIGPYYDIARTNALQTYHEIILPSYLVVRPYALQGYDAASTFTAETAVPGTLWAWNKTYLFLDSTVWPQLRDVYVLKVEPQLVRIGERLGRYREKKAKTVVTDEVESTTAKSTFAKPTGSGSSTTTAESTVEPTTAATSTSVEPESKTTSTEAQETSEPPTREQIRENAIKVVAEDLELWQGKFSKAADEGASEIEDQVHEISTRAIEQQASVVGQSLASELDETVKAELGGLKRTIVAILEHAKDAKDDTAEEEITAAVRGAGLKIKNKAQDVRKWRQQYEQDLEAAVTKAAAEHIRILEEVRDLALQKIGMRWAWMDGITHKDWQKFHQLRERFDEWTGDLKRLVTTHPGLAEAQAAGTEVENEAMGIAGAAAQELGSLKQTAAWKLIAGDSSDDFDVNTAKLAAEAAQKKAADALAAATEGVQSVAEKVEDGAQSIGEAVLEGASAVVSKEDRLTTTLEGTETHSVTVSLSEVKAADTSAVPPLESLTAEATESATDLVADADGTRAPSAAEEATSAADSVEPLPTSDPIDGPEQVEETIVASPEDPTPSAAASTATIKPALFGAAAQSVPSRQPILDEDVGSSISSVISVARSDLPHTVTSAAQSAYTAALAQAADKYSRAMSAVSVQISGEPKPAHEELLSSVSNAYFGAIASANAKLQDSYTAASQGANSAATAASEGIYGTTTARWIPDIPVPTVDLDWEKVQSIAQQNLQDSISWAGAQFENAKVAIGAAEPTPSTVPERAEKLLDQAKHNYYAGLGVAHERYSEFLAAASTALSSVTATPTPTNIQGTASSIASAAGESASSAASVASEAAASVASSAGDSVSDAGESVAENWDFLVSRVSSQIYGAPTPTPWYENLYAAAGGYAAQAGDYAASATGAAGEYASSAGDYAAGSVSSATSLANDYGDAASSAAASQYSAVSSLVSELLVGKEPTFTESVYMRLQGAYAAASSSASSVASEATEAVASVASGASVTAVSAASAAADTVSSVTGKVKETVGHVIDEL